MTSSISNILNLERTQLGAHCSSKKKLIQHVSQFLASNIEDAQADDIYERLITREKLGSTGIGEGIAIPHSRLEECIDTVGALFILDEPIDYDAIDRQPVDIVFVLLVPAEATEQHLQTLSMLAQKFSKETYREQLRSAKSQRELYQLATA
ncbi:PTS IIA-like nitrogen regulatory protein PtsN [Oceaniserpentilla sp. 4NH20-0058]|uniref:PTS IIA-like nitrogen regulatory protein PtsN n=1 Tax=Oceaniserpentilla sp. 4NH20-0058 TaxID=3127660 RepID=UPI00310C50A9